MAVESADPEIRVRECPLTTSLLLALPIVGRPVLLLSACYGSGFSREDPDTLLPH